MIPRLGDRRWLARRCGLRNQSPHECRHLKAGRHFLSASPRVSRSSSALATHLPARPPQPTIRRPRAPISLGAACRSRQGHSHMHGGHPRLTDQMDLPVDRPQRYVGWSTPTQMGKAPLVESDRSGRPCIDRAGRSVLGDPHQQRAGVDHLLGESGTFRAEDQATFGGQGGGF